MGNSSSNVSAKMKEQITSETQNVCYELVDMKGGGILVEAMKQANKTKNYAEVTDLIHKKVGPLLYNKGQGKKVPIRELVLRRNKERETSDLKKKLKGSKKNKEGVDNLAMLDMKKDEDGNYIGRDIDEDTKEICWSLDKRGAVGETALHLCLLNATSVHADLAKKLLQVFPKLIVDIYQGEEYYGENVLHMAIVNEDPAMVKFLLDYNANFHERCCGNFFCPMDQQASRTDSLDHEWVDVAVKTNYEGYTYWGEYPLGFAACLGQEECVRLLIAKGADPNKEDANGNTVMHMLVIHDKKEMFDLLIELGARLDKKNRQNLTPLTLAAKLARKDMYEHILEITREVYWIYGNVTCAGYPLTDIDTISATGEINKDSALHKIIHGDQPGHINMVDGVVVDLLKEKWKTFVRFRFYRRLVFFLLYFAIFLAAFLLRPGTDLSPSLSKQPVNGSTTHENKTVIDRCYLMEVNSNQDYARFVLEGLMLFGACCYLVLAAREILHQGGKIFFETLKSAPAKLLFLNSCVFVVLMVPGRAACAPEYEDIVAVCAVLGTAPYFLFFCRGVKIVGPFVVMIYKMIIGDLLRFVTIYIIFLCGFSQAMYIVFLGVNDDLFSHPMESIMGMLYMSLGEFGDIYSNFDKTKHPTIAKAIFVLYMVLVTLLLINMLIAMMGNTYTLVNETQKEWQRQWAHIVLVVEQTVTTKERISQQKKYSQPMADGRRAYIVRWHQSEKEREDIKRIREQHRLEQHKMVQKKKDGRIRKSTATTRQVSAGHFNV